MGLVYRPPDLIDQAADTAARVRATELVLASRARGPVDRWHSVGDPAGPFFTGDWANYGQGTNPVGFSREPSGFVTLRGVAVPNVAPTSPWPQDHLLFTLPAGYRPASRETITVGAIIQRDLNPGGQGQSIYANVFGATTIQILPDGSVVGGSFVTQWISLDNVRFRIPA